MIEKYSKVFKQDSDQWLRDHQDEIIDIGNSQYRLSYHIMPEIGWLNDPNGLCQVNGFHHQYFQYCPYNIDGSFKTWGHVMTKNFIDYEYCPIALYPDSDYDQHGVYSGCCFYENGTMNFFYTGNVKLFDRNDYDYINSGRLSNTLRIQSQDGLIFNQKELVLSNPDYPKNLSNHIRDPKVFKFENKYYLVLGARRKDNWGCVILYVSDDLVNWDFYTEITTEKPFGYMWECPDMFLLDGQWVLTCCPQGVVGDEYQYTSIYQSVYMFLDADFEKKDFKITKIQELDCGFDFYAQQSYVDESERIIMLGWMGMPDVDYDNLSISDGWQHALTIPRQLKLKNGCLVQEAVSELENLRANHQNYSMSKINQLKLSNSYELLVNNIDFCNFELNIGNEIVLSYNQGVLEIDITKIGCGRKLRKIRLSSLKDLRIFRDVSSVEIFINNGEYSFTSRIYSQQLNSNIQVVGNNEISLDYYDLSKINIRRNNG